MRSSRAAPSSRTTRWPPASTRSETGRLQERATGRASGQIEILVVLPGRHLGGVAGLAAGFGVAARDLGPLDVQVIVDKDVAKAFAKAGAVFERGQRLGE